MTTKMQEEKQQKILKQLMSLPENKRCADCTAKGPVYVNTSLNTFVCTTCSGIHREFNHRVKSVSMASFRPEEIKTLQEGGNQAARDKYLARWTPDEFPEPDPSDQDRIRTFIRLKYVDKRWIAGSGPASSQQNRRQPTATREPDMNVKVEPLQKILGGNIPPIKVDGRTSQPQIQAPAQPQAHDPFFDSSNFPSISPMPNPHTTPTPAPVPAPTPVQAPNSDPFFSSPFPAQNNQPTQAAPQDKAKDLKAQLGSMYQQQAVHQQQAWMMQMPGQNPQVMANPQLPQMAMNPQLAQQMAMNPQFAQQQQLMAQQILAQQMAMNPQLAQQMAMNPQFAQQQQMMAQQMAQQMIVQQAMMTQQMSMTPQITPQYPVTPVPGIPGVTPIPGQLSGTWGASPAVVAPISIEPEKKDPFASLSISNLSKLPTSSSKIQTSSTTASSSATQITTPPKSQKQDDLFGFSTSPAKSSGMDFGFPNGNSSVAHTTPAQHSSSEFNPFGISQSINNGQTRAQPPDFNPFF